MNTARTVAKNTGVLSAAQVITMALRLVFITYMARSLGDVGFGKIGFAQSFTGLMVIFADIGLSALTVREIARERALASRYLGSVLAIKAALSILALAVIFIAINCFDYPADTIAVVYIIGLATVFSSYSDYLRALFRAFEKMEFEAALNITKGLITTTIGVSVLFAGFGIIAVAWVYLLSATVDFALAYGAIRKRFISTKPELDIPFAKSILKLAFPFSLTALCSLIYAQVDVVMLSLMKGDAPVGWYKAATILVYSLMSIPNIFSFALYPLVSRLYVSSRDALKMTVERSSKYLLSVGLPMGFGIFLLSDRLIVLLYGSDFVASSMVLRIVSIYLPLRCINNIAATALSSIDKEPYHAFSLAAAAGTNFLLNLIAIPRFGANGAALTTSMTEALLFGLYSLFLARHFCRIDWASIAIKPFLSCLAMAALILVLRDMHLGLLITVSAVWYFAVLFCIRGFDAVDVSVLRSLRQA